MPIAHPMHVHLVKFEIVQRCALPTKYPDDYPYRAICKAAMTHIHGKQDSRIS